MLGHMNDGRTQFLPSVHSYWLVAFSVTCLIKVSNANLPLDCQMHDIYANCCAN